ncbi:MAG: DNA-binding protein WhiA, partial [Firmicutes bacterium]|nr:DNA-binding protein WhiA [Candidatus Caballimonas caccae]
MNFGKTIKEEILSKPPKERCCKKSFLAGLIRGTGVIFDDGTSFGVDFSVATEETVMLISNYLKILYDYELREVSVDEDRLNKKDKFTLTLSGEKAELILLDLGIFIEQDGEMEVNLRFYENLNKEGCIRAFFRGVFLSIGNCSVPSKEDSVNTGYHLELVFSHYTPALETSEKLAEAEVLTKITRRKDSFIVYIKSVEEINNFIAFLGAPVSVLKLTDLMINRDISNNSNRQRNCYMGNGSRLADAVNKNLIAIDKIEATIG